MSYKMVKRKLWQREKLNAIFGEERMLKFSHFLRRKGDYYRYGLYTDDLIRDDKDVVIEALSRLSEKEAFDRDFRLQRNLELEFNHDYLPEEEWVRLDTDKSYLWPIIKEVVAEIDQQKHIDSLKPQQLKAEKGDVKSSYWLKFLKKD